MRDAQRSLVVLPDCKWLPSTAIPCQVGSSRFSRALTSILVS